MKSLLGTYRRSDVIFRSDGRFDLTARVVRALGISPGDVIDVMSDGCEYYLYVAHHPDTASCSRFEAQVFPSKTNGRGLHFRGSSARLCRAVLAVTDTPRKAALPCGQVVVDENGRRLLPIIVRLNLADKK